MLLAALVALAPTLAHAPDPCTWRAEPLPISEPASWGSITPALALTAEGDGARVWYPSGYREPMRTARLTADGGLETPTVVSMFSGLGEDGYPVLSVDGQVAVSTIYVGEKNADIFLATRQGAGWSAPISLRPDGGLDTDPVVARAGDRTAVAWSTGTYPFAPDLAVAIVAEGRVTHSGVVIKGAHAEGSALVAVPAGWLLLYTPSSAGPMAEQGLVAALLDHDGALLSRRRIAQGALLWPVATAGQGGVGVVFRSGRQVGFIQLDLDGEPLGEPVRADWHPDPIAGFRPMSLVADETGWWLADVAGFTASVIVAGPSQARVVRLDAAGSPAATVIVSDAEHGGGSIRLLPTAEGVRGVTITDRGGRLQGFTMRCGEPPPPPAPPPCAPARLGGSDARAGILDAVAVDGDLVAAARDGDILQLRRLSPEGRVRWMIPAPGREPRLAAREDEVAVLSGESLTLHRYAARTGRALGSQALPERTGAACIAARDDGWLVVRSRQRTAEVLLLDAQGAIRSTENLDEAFWSCDLLQTPEGFLLTTTRSGPVSETSYLYTRRLDPLGAPAGPEHRVTSVSFARRPQLSAHDDLTLLTFTGPLSREVSAVALDAEGQACGEHRDIAETYGLTGYTAWGERFVWSTRQEVSAASCMELLRCPQ
jgi:hypothetical protein